MINLILMILWIPLVIITFIYECIVDTIKWVIDILKKRI